jgi:hypothetical protein
MQNECRGRNASHLSKASEECVGVIEGRRVPPSNARWLAHAPWRAVLAAVGWPERQARMWALCALVSIRVIQQEALHPSCLQDSFEWVGTKERKLYTVGSLPLVDHAVEQLHARCCSIFVPPRCLSGPLRSCGAIRSCSSSSWPRC